MPKSDTSYVVAARAVRESREQQIRDLFRRTGPLSTRALVKRCIDEAIFSDTEIESAYVRSFQGIIREALSADDDTGMPEAGPSIERDDDGAPIWKQRGLWDYGDYESNINDLIANRNAGHIKALRLAAECERRFQRRVVVVELPDA